MSLNLVIGRSNSGKTEYLINKIMACEENKKQAILFVPSSSRVIAEEEYLKYTNKKVLINTIVTSMERFIDRRVDKSKLYKDKTYLKDMAKKMMIKKTISENDEMFKVFAKVKDSAGFTDKISDYVDRLANLQNLDVLDKYEEQDFLKTKLDEFRAIYLKLQEKLKDRFVEATDEMKTYIQMLNDNEVKLDNVEVFIDGYNNFSNIEYDFIQALLLTGVDVYITLDLDKKKYLEQMTEIYNTSYDTLTRLKEIAATAGIKMDVVEFESSKENTNKDIEHLANNIFNISKNEYNQQVENVKLVLNSNMYEEIKYVANSILKDIKDGYEYKDIAIYTNNILMYNVNIKKVLDIYNIPMYINEEGNIINNRLVAYLTTLLNILLTGFTKSIENILVLLKTGMLDISESDIYMFENYVLEFGVRGYNMQSEFTLNNDYDLEKLNDVRQQVLNVVTKLKQDLSSAKTSKQITEQIYCYLTDENVIKKYEQELEIIKQIDINEYNKNKQVVSKLYEVMDNICLAYDKITLAEYVELLEYGMCESKVETVPAKLNQVEVVDINKSRGTNKKIGYIIGCYDGGLPTVQTEDNIFTDIELEKLKAAGIDLKQTSEERHNMQLFNIYQVISKIREKLIFTVPSSSYLGASLRPSSLIQEIKMLLNINLDAEQKSEILNMNEDFMQFISILNMINENYTKEQIEEIYERYLLYKDIPKYSDILKYSRRDKNLEKDTLNKLYSKNISSSVSRLEQFKRCPFAYYTKYILNLKERKEYVMSSLDTGAFMHEVIEKFSKFIVAKNIAWQDIVLDNNIKNSAENKIDEIVDKHFEEDYSKYLTSAKYIVLKAKMKKAMKRTIFAIADSFNHSDFRPLGYEIEFEKDALFAPIEVVLDDGTILLLRGKIDRIDSLKVDDNTYLRIVDYKSSDRNLKLSDVKEGLSLQLMTYMCAMLENKEKLATENVIPAALSYFTISNKILSIPNFEQDNNKIAEKVKKALKLRGIYIKDIEILKRLDNNVENNKESYLEVSTRSINNVEKVLPEETFIEECKNVRNILKDISKEITKGKVKIEPNKNITGVCDYCSYSSVCRKNILN